MFGIFNDNNMEKPLAFFPTENQANAWAADANSNPNSGVVREVFLDTISLLVPSDGTTLAANTPIPNMYLVGSVKDWLAIIGSVIPLPQDGTPDPTDSYVLAWRNTNALYERIRPCKIYSYRTVTLTEVTAQTP
jgi:hypothetical protein